ncbi:MAG TPA: RodZ domain-containing protein [Solirubrobacterales bacterium]|nr:RodZ domain-containing protein [Solirubrobacterales bacterium]
MDRGVGTILQTARDRRGIELAEVEAATRIRLRYLSAIENEEWDVLPGGVYTRGFIRTYASFLGLDGERLVEDYRRSVERWHRGPTEPVHQGAPAGAGGASRRPSVPLVGLAVLAVVAVAALAILAIPDGGGGGGDASAPAGQSATAKEHKPQAPAQRTPKSGVAVSLTAGAEVWVCLLDASGKALVDGEILQAGAEAGPFRSGSFTVSFGNGEVEMQVDGREADIPETSSPVGYAIESSGELTELDEAERPSCT